MHNTFDIWISLCGPIRQARDTMNLARGFQVVLTPFIPAAYSSPVIYTHKRVDTAGQGECSVVTRNIHIH